MGAAQEDAMEGGGRTGHLGKVLLHGDIGGAVVRGVDVVVVGANGTEARGISFGVPTTGG